ncbi:hypothetical protein PUN28_017478 [Cardiocondyla obscurior]|uniref:Uncharacterized protein n=1 Tax=Cardiocondyla obscurior TaxID=286306 RepID=A0AAW2EIJ7_9HYME
MRARANSSLVGRSRTSEGLRKNSCPGGDLSFVRAIYKFIYPRSYLQIDASSNLYRCIKRNDTADNVVKSTVPVGTIALAESMKRSSDIMRDIINAGDEYSDERGGTRSCSHFVSLISFSDYFLNKVVSHCRMFFKFCRAREHM